MVWYVWKWWRLAWGCSGGGRTSDSQGLWISLGRLYILVRRLHQPMAQKTLYKQAYHRLIEKGFDRDDAVDIALDTREAFGNHPALSLKQLDCMIECNVEEGTA